MVYGFMVTDRNNSITFKYKCNAFSTEGFIFLLLFFKYLSLNAIALLRVDDGLFPFSQSKEKQVRDQEGYRELEGPDLSPQSVKYYFTA
jgi:hypothetical protein